MITRFTAIRCIELFCLCKDSFFRGAELCWTMSNAVFCAQRVPVIGHMPLDLGAKVIPCGSLLPHNKIDDCLGTGGNC